MTADRMFTDEESIAYWDARHRDEVGLRSGGNTGLGQAGNEVFYARRLGVLLALVGDLTSTSEPLFLLDAGCGKGYFARALARCGHRIDGIDTSPAAISACREAGGGPRYHRARLAQWHSPWLYDAVYAVDVCFHITDDAEWESSLANLASLVRLAGMLVVTDEHVESRVRHGSYIVHRTREDYMSVLGPHGLAAVGFRPYDFRDSRVGFHVFTRTH